MSDSHLPSLNALRAFTVAASHLNLRAAADVLFVTPSALSHQIRSLEQQLGVKLFDRGRRGLSLTEVGRALQPQLAAGFAQIGEAVRQLKPARRPGVVTVSMLSTFAMRWFIPRLCRFQQQHPDIEVRISTSLEPVDFGREDFDCAIRSGHGDWPGLHVEKLFSERLAPVCSPTLQLGSPQDLSDQTLLHARLRPDDWRIWLHSAGAGGLRPTHEQTFETRNFAIQAAIDGLGVAVVDPALVRDELASSRLVQPFSQILPTTNAYHLVWPEERPLSAALQSFREWLLAESGR